MTPLGEVSNRLAWFARAAWLNEHMEETGWTLEYAEAWTAKLIYACGTDSVEEAFYAAMHRFDVPDDAAAYIAKIARNKAAACRERRAALFAKAEEDRQ